MILFLTASAAAVAATLIWRERKAARAADESDAGGSAAASKARLIGEPEVIGGGRLSSALTALGERSFDFITELLDLGDEKRQEHMAKLSTAPEREEVDSQSRELQKQLGVSLTAFGASVAGALVAPPLSLLSVPLLGYITLSRGKLAYETLRDEQRLSMSVLDTLIGLGVITTGLFVAGSFAYVVTAGSMLLLRRTAANSRHGLINVFGERPRTVWLLVDGVEVEVPFESLRVGWEVVVHAGGQIPIDGVVVDGVATVDQRVLTGESHPVIRSEGEHVLASTTVLAGSVVVRALRTGSDTIAGQIGEILNSTADFELGMQLRGLEIADRSVLPTILLGGLALNVVGVSGALAVLTSSMGWPLRVVTPLTLHSYLRRISEQGILIKDGRAIELIGRVDTFVFDKTGTLTDEQPRIAKVTSLADHSELEVLTYAAAAEYRQTHPIARAILHAAASHGITAEGLDEVSYEIGRGIVGRCDGVEVRVGSEALMDAGGIEVLPSVHARQQECTARGRSMVMVAVGGRLIGTLEWQPTIREEVHSLIATLKRRGAKTAVISGDREAPTRRLSEELGIDEYHAEVLPGEKAALVEQYQAAGRTVCFVGDGINDTLALKSADVSISLAGATSAAVDSAQIVLMDGSLTHLEALLEIADAFDHTIERNTVYAFAPGAICIFGGFFLGMGLVSSLLVQVVGLSAAVRNARG